MSNREGIYGSKGIAFPYLGGILDRGAEFVQHWFSDQHRITRRVMVGAILVLALLAFELFNFDTTEYALEDLLGTVSFAGVRWATILAIAFCSIDFAGLARLIAPDTPDSATSAGRFLKPSWLLLGAWLLGGAMNAIMTWWSVSLALMGHSLGNEVLTREQLLRIVPIFVAVLVWVTRILIISSFTITADQPAARAARRTSVRPTARPSQTQAKPALPAQPQRSPRPQPAPTAASSRPVFVGDESAPAAKPNGRPPVRPQMPRPPRGVRPGTAPVSMRDRSRN